MGSYAAFSLVAETCTEARTKFFLEREGQMGFTANPVRLVAFSPRAGSRAIDLTCWSRLATNNSGHVLKRREYAGLPAPYPPPTPWSLRAQMKRLGHGHLCAFLTPAPNLPRHLRSTPRECAATCRRVAGSVNPSNTHERIVAHEDRGPERN